MAARRASARPLRCLRALRRRSQSACHLFHLVRLDDVAGLDVLIPLEREAALVPGRNLADVLLEALEAPDPPVVHDALAPEQARAAAARDLPVGPRAARDLADAGHDERLPHLGTPEDLLLQRRLEESLERVAHVVQRLVDDGIETDVDALALGERRGLRLGTDVEPD